MPDDQTLHEPKSSIEPALVAIPAGEFWMGSAEDDPDASWGEKPRHRQCLPEYWIGRYPVTQQEYHLFLVDNPDQLFLEGLDELDFPAGIDDHPAQSVSWVEAMAYCRWLSRLSSKTYRLPTEAEWEKAARGTDERIYPWGNMWDPSRCNSVESKIHYTTPVSRYSPNGDSPYGVADLAGNVWEWCSSLYQPYPYKHDEEHEALRVREGRVLRGGSYEFDRSGVRVAGRSWGYPGEATYLAGFRVVAVTPAFSLPRS
jgi:formylglycine-generating enzyme required for sulfatase activity